MADTWAWMQQEEPMPHERADEIGIGPVKEQRLLDAWSHRSGTGREHSGSWLRGESRDLSREFDSLPRVEVLRLGQRGSHTFKPADQAVPPVRRCQEPDRPQRVLRGAELPAGQLRVRRRCPRRR